MLGNSILQLFVQARFIRNRERSGAAVVVTRNQPVAADNLVIFIGGFWDRFTHIVSTYSTAFGMLHSERQVSYFEHDHTERLLASVMQARERNDCASLVLVGHSWGAMTAIKAALSLERLNSPADLVVTIDPVSRKRIAINAEATTWININAAPAISNGWNGDHYAALGGKWRDWPAAQARRHYDAPFHHNEFRALLEYAPPDECSALHCVLATGTCS